MSANDAPRPGSVPATPHRLKIWHVPEEGGITVRFLGDPDGILVHGPNRRLPCPGLRHCKECSALKRGIWKGFAPSEVWIEDPAGCAWMPAVLEISDRLLEHLGNEPLRGSVWYCYRQMSEGKHKECAGHQVDSLSPSSLQAVFDVSAVVQRSYGTPHIEFGRKPPLKARPFVRPVEDGYVPPTSSPAAETPEQKHARELQ